MDHIKLAKERDRMCEAHSSGCSYRCPLFLIAEHYHDDYSIARSPACRLACMYESEKAVAIISKWAAENPEPRYPTWREWFLTFLPEVPEKFHVEISGLTVVLYTSRSNNYVDYYSSVLSERSCGIDNPIPADIAEVLKIPMITPKGACE